MTGLIGKNYSVYFDTDAVSLSVSGGSFGEITLFPAPLFHLRLKRIADGTDINITSADTWRAVTVSESGKEYSFIFEDPTKILGISVKLLATASDEEIVWTGSVINESNEYSVMEMTYPALSVGGEKFDLFAPETSGIVIKDAGRHGYVHRGDPAFSMQYLAAYKAKSGIYFGIHDPAPVLKRYDVRASDGIAKFAVYQIAENGTLPKNSFTLSGKCVWKTLCGDWYDASKIYSRFVRSEAEWIPKLGRPDTPQKFKEIPFWVCDYIPNSPSQGDNRPMKLSAGSDIYEEGYWYKAVIELQRELDVPIAYHVYNWHTNPFNVNYPHFLPAKEEFKKGLRELKKHNIYVTPYINALSWETRDDFDGIFDFTFENTGKALSVKLEDGRICTSPYPQTHNDGKSVLLAATCPSTATWQKIIKDLSKEMEETLDIDGIYFDQISAGHGRPCYDPTHGHPLGGGRHWYDGSRKLMRDIIKEKPQEAFYFSEDNTEEYMDLFDGFLTWRWLMNEAVPAFPTVYAGYIQMLGRSVLGTKKDDVEFFKYTLAKAFLYGQQLGWIKADVIYSEKKLAFLKTLVRERYKYTSLFCDSEMLRPPKIESDLTPKRTTPALHFTEEVVMEGIYAGAWKSRSEKKTVIFIINTSDETVEYTLSFDNREYMLDGKALEAHGFILGEDGRATKTATISPESIVSIEL